MLATDVGNLCIFCFTLFCFSRSHFYFCLCFLLRILFVFINKNTHPYIYFLSLMMMQPNTSRFWVSDRRVITQRDIPICYAGEPPDPNTLPTTPLFAYIVWEQQLVATVHPDLFPVVRRPTSLEMDALPPWTLEKLKDHDPIPILKTWRMVLLLDPTLHTARWATEWTFPSPDIAERGACYSELRSSGAERAVVERTVAELQERAACRDFSGRHSLQTKWSRPFPLVHGHSSSRSGSFIHEGSKQYLSITASLLQEILTLPPPPPSSWSHAVDSKAAAATPKEGEEKDVLVVKCYAICSSVAAQMWGKEQPPSCSSRLVKTSWDPDALMMMMASVPPTKTKESESIWLFELKIDGGEVCPADFDYELILVKLFGRGASLAQARRLYTLLKLPVGQQPIHDYIDRYLHLKRTPLSRLG
jgi:hypothetical protein